MTTRYNTLHIKILNPEMLTTYLAGIKTFNPDDSGFNLYFSHEYTKENKIGMSSVEYNGFESKLLGTGIAVSMTDYLGNPIACHLRARSSISKTEFLLHNGIGTIDRGYSGQVLAPLLHFKEGTKTVGIGESLVQICHPSDERFNIRVVDTLPNEGFKRGAGGFGSTNKERQLTEKSLRDLTTSSF